MLTYSSKSYVSIQLPQGPMYDSFRLQISVSIIDDMNAETFYNISSPVYSYPDLQNNINLMNQIANKDPTSSMYKSLQSGSTKTATTGITNMASILNSNTPSPGDLSQITSARDSLMGFIDNLSVSDLSSVKLIGSALSSVMEKADQLSDKSFVSFQNQLKI